MEALEQRATGALQELLGLLKEFKAIEAVLQSDLGVWKARAENAESRLQEEQQRNVRLRRVAQAGASIAKRQPLVRGRRRGSHMHSTAAGAGAGAAAAYGPPDVLRGVLMTVACAMESTRCQNSRSSGPEPAAGLPGPSSTDATALATAAAASMAAAVWASTPSHADGMERAGSSNSLASSGMGKSGSSRAGFRLTVKGGNGHPNSWRQLNSFGPLLQSGPGSASSAYLHESASMSSLQDGAAGTGGPVLSAPPSSAFLPTPESPSPSRIAGAPPRRGSGGGAGPPPGSPGHQQSAVQERAGTELAGGCDKAPEGGAPKGPHTHPHKHLHRAPPLLEPHAEQEQEQEQEQGHQQQHDELHKAGEAGGWRQMPLPLPAEMQGQQQQQVPLEAEQQQVELAGERQLAASASASGDMHHHQPTRAGEPAAGSGAAAELPPQAPIRRATTSPFEYGAAGACAGSGGEQAGIAAAASAAVQPPLMAAGGSGAGLGDGLTSIGGSAPAPLMRMVSERYGPGGVHGHGPLSGGGGSGGPPKITRLLSDRYTHGHHGHHVHGHTGHHGGSGSGSGAHTPAGGGHAGHGPVSHAPHVEELSWHAGSLQKQMSLMRQDVESIRQSSLVRCNRAIAGLLPVARGGTDSGAATPTGSSSMTTPHGHHPHHQPPHHAYVHQQHHHAAHPAAREGPPHRLMHPGPPAAGHRHDGSGTTSSLAPVAELPGGAASQEPGDDAGRAAAASDQRGGGSESTAAAVPMPPPQRHGSSSTSSSSGSGDEGDTAGIRPLVAPTLPVAAAGGSLTGSALDAEGLPMCGACRRGDAAPSFVALNWLTRPSCCMVVCKPAPAVLPSFLWVLAWLHEQGITSYVEPTMLRSMRQPGAFGSSVLKEGAPSPLSWSASEGGDCHSQAVPHDVAQAVDFVVVLGGDGTVLWTCHIFGNQSVPPMVPFNLGSLGFLTPFDPSSLECVLGHVVEGGFPIMLRHRLHCHIERAGAYCTPCTPTLAAAAAGGSSDSESADGNGNGCGPQGAAQQEWAVLNEVTIDRGISPYLSNLECFCDGSFVTHVQGDGLIVATPTGSTAYNLAAGGSMVHPQVPGILFTPICPHSLSFRPLLFPDHVLLCIQVPPNSRSESWCSFDGKDRQKLNPGDAVMIRSSSWPVPVVCNQDASRDWFSAVREGLHWNMRKVQGGAGQ